MPIVPTGSVHGPYEDLAIALIGLIEKAMDGQPPEVRAKLWQMHVEDIEKWRSFWDKFGDVFKPKTPAVK